MGGLKGEFPLTQFACFSRDGQISADTQCLPLKWTCRTQLHRALRRQAVILSLIESGVWFSTPIIRTDIENYSFKWGCSCSSWLARAHHSVSRETELFFFHEIAICNKTRGTVWVIGSISDPIISWISECLMRLRSPPASCDMQQKPWEW